MNDIPSSSLQSSFLGGEWSPTSHGRIDRPEYLTALAMSINGLPIEEGSWVRRSGTEFICPTHQRLQAKLLAFDGSETCSFGMEFTPLNLRFLTQTSLICNNTKYTVLATDNTNGHVQLSGSAGYAANDELLISFPDTASPLFPYTQAKEIGLRNRVLTVGLMSTDTITTLEDDRGQAFDYSTWPSGALVGAQVVRVLRLTTPFTVTDLPKLRRVQAEKQCVILSGTKAAQVVTITSDGSSTTDPVFTFAALTFLDGPYIDPQGTQGVSLSGLTGDVTITGFDANTWASTDVGRHVRIFTQPAAWAVGTTYAKGDRVTDSLGAWWVSLDSSNTGNIPGTAPVAAGIAKVWWAPAPNAGSWAWGVIKTFNNTTSIVVTISTLIPGMTLQTANGTTATYWQKGVYSPTGPVQPSCGTYAEGRLWLSGAVKNRIDASTSNGMDTTNGYGNGTVVFSPTDPNGYVLDDSAIAVTLNTKGLNQIQWMVPDQQGIIIGTLEAEFLLTASSQSDPFTPTSIQQHEVTRYGSLNSEPIRAGMALIYGQKLGRRVMEYLPDLRAGAFGGRHLNEYAKHLTVSGVAEVHYQEEPVPIVWARMNNGLLAGCTYRRFSRYLSDPPAVQGWHWHPHGGNRVYTSMCVVPGSSGLVDRLFTVTQDAVLGSDPDPAPDNYFIEVLHPTPDVEDTLEDGWFCDQAPGLGPGNSGDDCGGGNAFTFTPSAGPGADTFTPDMSTVGFIPNLPAAGGTSASPPAGGVAVLREATYFPGSVGLIGLPTFPSGTGTDTQALSMSVWLGVPDFPLRAGALLSSPALTFTEADSTTKLISNLVAGSTNYLAGLSNAAKLGSIGPFGYPDDASDDLDLSSLTGGLTWLHLMVSMQNSAGHGRLTAAVNDTVLFTNHDMGTYTGASSNIWPFSTQKGGIKDNGLSAWTIGGVDVVDPRFDLQRPINLGAPQTYTVPSLLDFLLNTVKGRNQAMPPAPAPSFGPIAQKRVFTQPPAKVQGSGGQGNLPYVNGIGAYAGYRGSVAELWIKPGTFIDWSNSANRYLFHEFDSITGSWGPVSLGAAGNGAGTGLGAAWIYLSGPPSYFSLNRANGKWLTVRDTSADLNGGLLASPLNFPT